MTLRRCDKFTTGNGQKRRRRKILRERERERERNRRKRNLVRSKASDVIICAVSRVVSGSSGGERGRRAAVSFIKRRSNGAARRVALPSSLEGKEKEGTVTFFFFFFLFRIMTDPFVVYVPRRSWGLSNKTGRAGAGACTSTQHERSPIRCDISCHT